MRGDLKTLVLSDPATWGALFLGAERQDVADWPDELNEHVTTWADPSSSNKLFGLDSNMVDNEELRGILLTIYTHAESFWDNFLTRSEWEWRHGRSVSFENIFILYAPGAEDSVHSVSPDQTYDTTKHVHLFNSLRMFVDNAGDDACNWKWFNSEINEVMASLTEYYFVNGNFGKIKAYLSRIKFSALKEPGESGAWAQLVYQCAHWEDGGALHSDVLKHKGLVDDNADGHITLCNRRGTDHNKRFLILGDSTIEQYRLLNSLMSLTKVSTDFGENASVIGGNNPLVPPMRYVTGFGFMVKKSEDLPPRISPEIHWLTAHLSKDTQVEYEDGANRIGYKTWVKSTGGLTDHTPISTRYSKVIYYHGRSDDPFKKLKHMAVDINYLDADFVVKDLRALFYPGGASQVASETGIKVSAMMDGAPKLEEKGEKVDDSMLKKEQPVSSIASATKDLQQAKADVKDAQKELNKEKKQEANK